MTNEIKKRYTAFKLPIGLLMKGTLQFEKNPEGIERFSFLKLDGNEINRVNLVATVIDKYQSEQSNYATLTVDDGTGEIRLKTFSDAVELLKEIQLGDTILVIGLLRYFNDEIYIQPEIIKPVDAKWLLARKLELEKNFKINYDKIISDSEKTKQTEFEPKETTEIEVEKIAEAPKPSLKDEILAIIKDAEAQGGIDIDEIIIKMSQPVDEIKNTITEMLENGEIFEPRAGRLRLL